MKAKHDVHLLHECKSHNVYPKFVRWKKLNSAINKRRQELKTSTEEQSLILLFIFYFSFFPFSNKNTKDTETTS